jgi:hypothetical protein
MRVVTKRMNDKPEICASALLLPVALILAACQPGAVPQSLAATPQWIAYTYLDGENVYAPQRLAQPPTRGSFTETEFERTPEGTRLRTVLTDGTLYVYLDVDQIWTSDPSWDVRQMLVADLDDDGQDEAAFVVWKPLTLEPSVFYDVFRFESPFVEGSARNHLFLYGWPEGEWRATWCSSPIADPIHMMAAGDVDGDGANELVLLEVSYDDDPDEAARHVAVWRWNGWGFTLQWRSNPGRFCDLMLQDLTGDEVPEIIVQDGC